MIEILHRLGGTHAQASVEYACVLLAFLAMIVASALLWRALSEGELVQKSVDAASHTTAQGVLGDVQDILLY